MNATSAATSCLDVRAVFVSDVHLGTKANRSDLLADFLDRTTCESLFLVGDMVDGWRLKKSWYWDAAHDRVLRALLAKVRDGTAVTYVPGNHDEMVRAWLPVNPEESAPFTVAGIECRREASHVTAAGRRMLVIHGDEFDSVVRYAKMLALLGSRAYGVALALNRPLNAVLRVLHLPYWSLSRWLKHHVKGAVKAIDHFETTLAADAARRGFDGVVCGHIHHAEMRMVNGVLYCNTGDWVESCTALVEHHDGRLELLDWAAANRLSLSRPKQVPQPA